MTGHIMAFSRFVFNSHLSRDVACQRNKRIFIGGEGRMKVGNCVIIAGTETIPFRRAEVRGKNLRTHNANKENAE